MTDSCDGPDVAAFRSFMSAHTLLVSAIERAFAQAELPPLSWHDVLATLEGAPAIELRVSDTGIGVPSQDLPRLTERFFRVDKARSRELGGTGLGLAIVKHIVQAHGGRLAIESTFGQGTTVHVTLPAAPDPDAPADAA